MPAKKGPKLKPNTLSVAKGEWDRIEENIKRRQQGLPEKTQEQLADELSGQLDRVITADAIRKAWKRAGPDVVLTWVKQRAMDMPAPEPQIALASARLAERLAADPTLDGQQVFNEELQKLQAGR